MTKEFKYKEGAKCASCERPYGEYNGFPDLILPRKVWEQISPTINENDLLCPCCIIRILYELEIHCEAQLFSKYLTIKNN